MCVGTRGVIPLSWSLDHVGPMCRTVDDTAILFEAMADLTPLSYRSPPSALRIGLPGKLYWEDLDPEVEKLSQEALRLIRGMVASVEEIRLPAADNLTIAEAEAYAFHEPWLAQCADLYSPPIRERLVKGGEITARAYILARREMERWREEIGLIFSDVDLIVAPTLPIKPVAIGTASDLIMIRNTCAFNVFGIPTISVPCGFTTDGFPVGLQIAGPRLGEARVLQLAYAYEQATEWWKRSPAL